MSTIMGIELSEDDEMLAYDMGLDEYIEDDEIETPEGELISESELTKRDIAENSNDNGVEKMTYDEWLEYEPPKTREEFLNDHFIFGAISYTELDKQLKAREKC